MKTFFGYIRVSTQKQGQHGVSLQEQRAAIERYARQNQITISDWHEERATAAKFGRPVFAQMLNRLRKGEAAGVIMHKIDRSARNLRDWTELGELIDSGIDVRFATDSIDLNTRGGRLSADIQAVVAADYIRNLREEARKGFYGRLNQGVYPIPAPVGYRDEGAGKPKSVDLEKAPLVRQLFDLYATGTHTLASLTHEAAIRGLRNRQGGTYTLNGISTILKNPFYTGLMKIKRTGETFRGAHEPLITKAQFERVQAVLQGRTFTGVHTHDFMYRRLLECSGCGRTLVGERQKGRVYYRCHRGCGSALREDRASEQILDALSPLQFDECEFEELAAALEYLEANSTAQNEKLIATVTLQLEAVKARYERLLDAYVDRIISKEDYEFRKQKLLGEEVSLKERLAEITDNPAARTHKLKCELELAKSVCLSYISASPLEKRELLQTISSNRLVQQKKLDITLQFPFDRLANRPKIQNGGPYRDRVRTFMKELVQMAMAKTPTSSNDNTLL
jgi:DNA invertase Pin-like site-specific DNA recombinase